MSTIRTENCWNDNTTNSESSTGSWFIICQSLCELISRVLEKIERIHNMPRKAEHLSFQGKILKIGAWVTELFYFLCSYSDFVRSGNFKTGKNWRCKFAHNSLVSEPIFKIFFPPKAVKLNFQRNKEFFKSVQKHGSYDWKTSPHGENCSNFTKT